MTRRSRAHWVTARVGYSITDVKGSTLILDPLQPLGPLASRFQQPVEAIDVEIAKNFTSHAGWNYYQYREGSFAGPRGSPEELLEP